MQASQPALATSLQSLSQRAPIPYCATFQGTGLWASPEHFVGRVGLFRNHRADRLLDAADCVITVGFDAIEYDSSISNTCTVVAIDVESIQQGQAFLPTAELIGDLAGTLDGLAPQLNVSVEETFRRSGDALTAEVRSTATEGAFMHGWPIHPPRDIYELQQVVTPETTV
jgi:acetolactate synthase-1/2/3 large subunit